MCAFQMGIVFPGKILQMPHILLQNLPYDGVPVDLECIYKLYQYPTLILKTQQQTLARRIDCYKVYFG